MTPGGAQVSDHATTGTSNFTMQRAYTASTTTCFGCPMSRPTSLERGKFHWEVGDAGSGAM